MLRTNDIFCFNNAVFIYYAQCLEKSVSDAFLGLIGILNLTLCLHPLTK